MALNQSRKLENWIRRMIYSEREEGERPRRFILRHTTIGDGSSQVEEWKIPKEGANDDWCASLQSDILLRAQDYAEGEGVTKFKICFYLVGDDKAHSMIGLTVDGGNRDNDDGLPSEPANKGGLIAQQMRHIEAIMRTSTMGQTSIMEILKRTVSTQADQIERLQAKHIESVGLYENLLSQQHEREILALQIKGEMRLKEELFEKVNLLLPTVVNRISGKNLLPEKTTPQAEIIGSVLESLTPEQMEQLQQVLKPEQIIPLFDLYEAERKRKEAMVKKEPALS